MEFEFKPYEKMIRSIVVAELTQNGWVDLIRMPLDNPEKGTPELVQMTIEKVRDFIFDNEKMHLDIQGESLCVSGIDKGKTLKVYASSTEYSTIRR